MWEKFKRHCDAWSLLVIIVTFLLFIIALFVKGVTHDILLEAGVFLVSVKLIMMGYKNSVNIRRLNERLDELKALLKK